MILIADSGSTKTEWVLVGAGAEQTCLTEGMNPVHLSADAMADMLRMQFTLPVEQVDVLYFYGAGCIPEKRPEMERMLRGLFRVETVEVESDLTGAARALCGRDRGVACILGTGSNSCLYDGQTIVKNIPPLGFILGDEGSGAAIGKKLVGDLFKGILPPELKEEFLQEYGLTYPEIIEAVYRRPMPGRFLAGFAPFVKKHLDRPEVEAIVTGAFSEFAERNLLQYDEAIELPVSFTGSIAAHFEPQLRRAMERYGLCVGVVASAPMAGLIEYHKQNEIR